MVPGQPATILRQLNRLLVTQSGQEQTDAQLLRRFAARREEAAFAALLARHGRLVWDVCRHTLAHEHDAEAAFPATSLVLARTARPVRQPCCQLEPGNSCRPCIASPWQSTCKPR